MNDYPKSDLDIPGTSGFWGRLHAQIGRIAIASAVRLRKPMSIGVRLLALNERGEVLLVRHSYLPGLMLPGGGVEPGETCHQAVIREAKEEAGVDVTGPLTLFHVYLNRALAKRDHVVLFVSRNAVQPRPTPPNLEILSAAFHSLNALPTDVTPATHARILEVLNGAEPSDFW